MQRFNVTEENLSSLRRWDSQPSVVPRQPVTDRLALVAVVKTPEALEGFIPSNAEEIRRISSRIQEHDVLFFAVPRNYLKDCLLPQADSVN